MGYVLNGKKLPERFWPGCALIKKFDLVWDGKDIDIPPQYWSDLAGLVIEESSLEDKSKEGVPSDELRAFLESLKKSRVYRSADGDTLMFEWDRNEECDSQSTLRWIIDETGTI